MTYSIGIDASRANSTKKTGVEHYAYEIIQHLKQVIPSEVEVFLYSKSSLKCGLENLPDNWESKVLNWRINYLWTQLRLSWEMFTNPPDVLFIPSHVFPILHPKTVMTVHDIAAERFPESYNFFERFYSTITAKYAVENLHQVIVPSKFTKQELLSVSSAEDEDIKVIRHGFEIDNDEESTRKEINQVLDKYHIQKPYIFFVGRIEHKKNIRRMIDVFVKLKQEKKYSGQFVLAGKGGYGFGQIKSKIEQTRFSDDIKLLGWVSDNDLDILLDQAQCLFFATLYEGFGFPVLEAITRDTPVITSDTTATKEIEANNIEYTNPRSSQSMYESLVRVIGGAEKQQKRKDGRVSTKYSWQRAAEKTAKVLLDK